MIQGWGDGGRSMLTICGVPRLAYMFCVGVPSIFKKTPVAKYNFCQRACPSYGSRNFLKPFAFAGTLFCLYSFSGFSSVQFYMMTIFTESGSSINSTTATLLVSCWRLVVSLIASFALHHISRRTLFFSTTFLVAASLASLGTFSYLKTLPD